MALLVAILLAFLVLPSSWEVPAIAVGGAWEAAEAYFWIKWSQRRRARVGPEALVGETARVVSRLDPEGQVRVNGELWRARAAEPVDAGAEVVVVALEGLTLSVRPAV